MLGNLCFIYKEDAKIIFDALNKIKKDYPKYINFIDEYFISNKLEYFNDFSLDYNRIHNGCIINNYLENFNGYIKSQL